MAKLVTASAGEMGAILRESGAVGARDMEVFVRAVGSGGIRRWRVAAPSRIIHMIRYVKNSRREEAGIR